MDNLKLIFLCIIIVCIIFITVSVYGSFKGSLIGFYGIPVFCAGLIIVLIDDYRDKG